MSHILSCLIIIYHDTTMRTTTRADYTLSNTFYFLATLGVKEVLQS